MLVFKEFSFTGSKEEFTSAVFFFFSGSKNILQFRARWIIRSACVSCKLTKLFLRLFWINVARKLSILVYWVNLRLSQTTFNHNQSLFLIVSDCFCCLASLQKYLKRKSAAHLHSAASALSSPSRCFQLSTNLDKDFSRFLLRSNSATIFTYAKRPLTSCVFH